MGYGKNAYPIFFNFSEGKLKTKIDDKDVIVDWVEGKIIDLWVKDDEYQGESFKKIGIMLFDDRANENYLVQMRLDSGYGISFCMLLPNILFSVPVRISGLASEKDGKKRVVCFVAQAGKTLSWYYTKDNPRDLPQLEMYQKGGKTFWDSTLQREFFIKNISRFSDQAKALYAVGKAIGIVKSQEETKTELPIESYSSDSLVAPIDDLPF